MNVVFADEAIEDLREIVLFLEQTDLTSAPFQDDLEQAVQQLKDWPDIGSRRHDLTRNRYVRFWLIDPYYVVYVHKADEISIFGVLHTSRDIRRELRGRLNKKPS